MLSFKHNFDSEKGDFTRMTLPCYIFKQSYYNISSFIRNLSKIDHVKGIIYTFFKVNQSRKYFHVTMASNFSTQNYQNQIQRNILIVGLGNHDMPKTRHSVGMQVLNKLARELDIQWIKDSKKYGGFVSVHEFKENKKCVLLKPKVAMNLNGKSVQKTASAFGVLPEDVYVVHDDLDKAVGKVGLKNGGSARGHNGVKSVHQCLRYEGMSRMLVGIDRPADKSRVAEYVLSTFNGNERPLIDTAIKECILLLSQEIYKKYGMKLLHQRDTG